MFVSLKHSAYNLLICQFVSNQLYAALFLYRFSLNTHTLNLNISEASLHVV